MKKFIFPLLIFGSSLSAARTIQAQSCLPVPPGLISWWPGNGNANDIQGANNGALQNGATFAPGKVGSAFSFDGVDDFVNVADALDLNNTTATWDFWFRSAQTNQNVGLISKHDQNGSTHGFTIYLNPQGFLFVQIKDNNISVATEVSSVRAINDGQLHHVAVSFKSGGATTLYIDGVAEGSAPATITFTFNQTPLRFGRTLDPFWAPLNGLLDEVEVFNRLLSPSEIQSIFNAGSAGKCKGPLAYEGFNTPSIGSLTGQSGASSFGWTGTWGRGGSSSDAQVVAGSLAAPVSTAGFYTVPPAPNHARAALGAQGTRTVNGSGLGATLWGSFIVDVTVNSNSSATIYFGSSGSPFAFGATSNSPGFWQISNGFTSFDSNTPYDPLTLAIFRIDYSVSGTSDRLRVWFNADPATAAPNFDRTDEYGTPPLSQVLFISSNNFSGSTIDIDEIRLGATLADVTQARDKPVITSPLAAAGTVGQQFTYQFVASDATSLSVSNLPPGLAFNTALGAIVGNPTASGTFPAGLSATNSGGTTTQTLTISVQPAPSSGPTIVSSTAATSRTGRPFSFQVVTTGGSPSTRLSASNLPSGLTADPVSGLISGTPAADGSFAVTLTVTDGNLTNTVTLQLTFTADLTIPVIVSSRTASLTPSQSFSYTINAPATSDPKTDPTTFTLIGTLPAGLSFDAKTGTISGIFLGNAQRSGRPPDEKDLSGGIISNVQLFATNSHGTSTIPLLFTLAPKGAVNISTRIAVGADDNVLIGGFIITGNAPKQVIIRAIAPSLKANGAPMPGALQDPTLELHYGDTVLGSNDNWRESQENEIIATGVPPTDEHESALIATLIPGNYTAILRGKDNTTGIAVVELYDLGTASLESSSKAQLAQISTRGTVLKDDHVMIGGFIISGADTKVIVRAIGPELNGVVPGALQDTMLELHDGSGSLINSNDDWRTSQEQQIIDTTVPPTDDRESAIVATLNPGNYTAIVRGKDNTIGVALVEVYGLQ